MSSNRDNTLPTRRAVDLTTPNPPRTAPGGGAATGGLGSAPGTVPMQDLSGDKLILSAPRTPFNEVTVPSLGGIPLLAKLGQGGMGAVYYGIHPRLQQEVAVKVLPFDMAERNPEVIQRFFREAQLAARVKSPHLISVLDVNQESGLFYIVMEYVAGTSGQGYLRQVIKTGAMGLHEAVALDLCIAASTGLAAAHAKGIIHRDVKPDNMMIPRDEQSQELDIHAAKLADLGLARSEALDRTTMTQSGACMGTPGFMAPEQASDAKTCGKPADVFSMGATLYALLTGRSPFAGSVLFKILKATIDDPHAPVGSVRPDISAPTAELLNRCLAKDPAARYVDAAALVAALKVCRAALGEPAQTALAVEKVSALIRAKEVGQPVRDVNQPVTPRPVTPLTDVRGSGVPPAKKSRAGLWAALLLVAAGLGWAGWHYGPLLVSAPKDETVAHTGTQKPIAPNPASTSEMPSLKVRPELEAATTQERLKKEAADKAAEQERARVEAARIAAENEKAGAKVRQRDETRAALSTAIVAAFDAKKNEDWKQVAQLLDTLLADPDNADHKSKALADGLLTQAKAELKKRADFDEKLNAGNVFLKTDAFDNALKAFAAAREIWPQAPNMNLVTAGEKQAREALGEQERARASALAKAEAERLAQEQEQKYRTALAAAQRAVGLFEKELGTQDEAEKAVNAVLAIREKDAKATALLEKLGPTEKYLTLDLNGGVKMDLVLIKPGTFEMGSPEGEKDRSENEKQHTVTISRAFYMAKFPVTQEQYEAVMNTKPSYFTPEKGGGPKNPVEQVSWNDAVEFCEKLDTAAKAKLPRGMKLQLPTEAQWEYACRAGTKTRFYTGDEEDDLARAGWYDKNSDSKTHPVGQKTPNAFGLYDIHGNVYQWCQDWYTSVYEKLPAKDPCNNAQGAYCVVRGGCWYLSARYCRSSVRYDYSPDYRYYYIGFRVVVSVPPAKTPEVPINTAQWVLFTLLNNFLR